MFAVTRTSLKDMFTSSAYRALGRAAVARGLRSVFNRSRDRFVGLSYTATNLLYSAPFLSTVISVMH